MKRIPKPQTPDNLSLRKLQVDSDLTKFSTEVRRPWPTPCAHEQHLPSEYSQLRVKVAQKARKDKTFLCFVELALKGALHEKSFETSSLCNLCVLCASVVKNCSKKNYHRDTENTEVAQRRARRQAFRARPSKVRNHCCIGSVQGAVATWSNRRNQESLEISHADPDKVATLPVLTRCNNDF